MIPDGWKIVNLREIVVFLDAKRIPLKKEDRNNRQGIYPYYGASGIIDHIDDYIFDDELLLLSEDGANILDRNYPIAFIATGKFWVNNHAHILKALNVNIYWLMNYLESLDYRKFNSGTAQPKLNREICDRIPILLPPPSEQYKITEIIGAWDESIDLLERLIGRVRSRKQGLMQQLLTGKKRFKEFEDNEWTKSQIKDVAKVITGNTPSTSVAEYYGGDFLFVSPSDLGQHKYISKSDKNLSEKGFATCRKVSKGSTLFTCIGSTIGKIGMAGIDLATNQQINSVVPTSIDNDFMALHYLVCSINE